MDKCNVSPPKQNEINVNLIHFLDNLKDPIMYQSIKLKFPDISDTDISRIVGQKFHNQSLYINNNNYKRYHIKLSFPKQTKIQELCVKYRILKEQSKQEKQVTEKQKKFTKIHELNDLKDMCDVLFGKLGEIEGKTILEIHKDFEVKL